MELKTEYCCCCLQWWFVVKENKNKLVIEHLTHALFMFGVGGGGEGVFSIAELFLPAAGLWACLCSTA